MKAQNHYDNFNGAVLNAAVWPSSYGTVGFASGGLQYTIASGGANYHGVTGPTVDLTSSFAMIELVSAGNQALVTLEVFPLQFIYDANNTMTFFINQNVLSVRKTIAGSGSQVGSTTPYSSTTHRFFRIRESNNVVYFDHSPDSRAWTNFQSETVANLFAVTSLVMEPSAGVWSSEASGTTVLLDNYNITKLGINPTFKKTMRPYPFAPCRAR